MFDGEDYIVISVRDTGIGIAEENKEKIFKKFIHVDDTSHRNREGSGIGLSLVKSFVEMHGGEITLESSYGQGSNFSVKLPIITIDESKEKRGNCISNDYVDRLNIEFSDIYK